MLNILSRHRIEIMAGIVTMVIVVTLVLFPETAQGVEIDFDPPPDAVKKGQAILLKATVNVPPDQFVTALDLGILAPDGELSTVSLPLEEGPFDFTGQPGIDGDLTGDLTIQSAAGFGYGYGYGNFTEDGFGNGYGYGYGFGGFSSGGVIFVGITYVPPTSGEYALSLTSVSSFDGEQAVAQDQVFVLVIDPSIDVEITASATEITSGDSVTLFISAMNDGDTTLTDPFVELAPLGLVLDDNSPAFTGGDSDSNGELNQGETWTWQTSISVNSSISINATGRTIDPLGDEITDSDQVNIAVIGDNLPPELAAISDRTLSEGDALQINVIATDPNGSETIALTISGQPAFVAFTDIGNGNGMLSISPGFDDAGIYDGIQITATDDGGLTDVELFSVQVINKNSPPDLAPIDNKVLSEGDTLEVGVSAIDPEGDPITLSASGLPVFASLDDQGSGKGVILVAPGFDDSGIYDDIEVEAADDSGLTDTETFSILVFNQNRAPQLAAIQNVSVDENDTVEVEVSAVDPDGDGIELSASGLPDFVTFTDNGDGTGILTFEPGFEDASLYTGLRVRASDGDLSDTESFTVTVNNVNRAPEIETIGIQNVDEGEILEVEVMAIDPDGDTVELTADGLPDFASFLPIGNGSGLLRFEPDFEDSGIYDDIEITAVDGGGLTDIETVTVVVENINRGPSLNSIRDRSVTEGDALIVRVNASDPDGDDIELDASGLPRFVSFTDEGNGTGTILIEPGLNDSGVYDDIEITAEDEEGLTDTESFVLTIINFNLPPVIEDLRNVQVQEGNSLTVEVEVTDPDDDEITITVTGLPGFAEFTDEGDGNGAIVIEPGFTDAGIYNGIEIVAEDEGGLTDTESFTFIVVNRNGPPMIVPIGELQVEEGQSLIEDVIASDPDGDDFTLQATNRRGGLPDFALFVDNGNGTGTLLIEPGFDDAGVYDDLEIEARDERNNRSSEIFTIVVIDVNRAPVLAPITDKTVNVGDILLVRVRATDADGDEVALTVSGLPDFADFTDNGDGTGTIVIEPGDDEDEGVFEDIEVTAEDEGGLTDTETFNIIVEDD